MVIASSIATFPFILVVGLREKSREVRGVEKRVQGV
jgi:hypothetical protein